MAMIAPTTKTPRFEGLRSSSVDASRIHQKIKRCDTRAEIALRQALWRLGLRFRKNLAVLPGKPDVVFARERVAVFCDGDFWHGRDWAERRRKLAIGSNATYWTAKISTNMVRDRRVNRTLRREGWKVVRVWESDIRRDPDKVAASIRKIVRLRRSF